MYEFRRVNHVSDKNTVVVIGGAGFIGSNLCEHLRDEYNVISLDCYFTGSVDNHVDGVEYRIGEAKDIASILADVPIVDIVYHFGEYSRVEQSFDDIELVFQKNQQMIHVLQYCEKMDCKLVYAGSSTKFAHSFGKGSDMSPYAWTKAQNTELVKSYATWFGIEYAIVYFYNVYGPREIQTGSYATLIAKFKEKTLQGEPLTVVLPGTQERNFTYVGDVVKALQLVGEEGRGDGYGIGHPTAYTVKQVADMFGGEVQYLPKRDGNRMSADLITQKTQDLGWTPQQSLEEHIQEFLNCNI